MTKKNNEIEAEAPRILKNIKWLILYGKDHKFFVSFGFAVLLLVGIIFKLNYVNLFWGKFMTSNISSSTEHSNNETAESINSPAMDNTNINKPISHNDNNSTNENFESWWKESQ